MVPRGHSPVALSTEARVAVDFVHTLGPVLAAVVPAVILVLTAVVTCVTWCTLTPGRQMGWGAVSPSLRSLWGLGPVCVTENLKAHPSMGQLGGQAEPWRESCPPVRPGTLFWYRKRSLCGPLCGGRFWAGRLDIQWHKKGTLS